MIAIKSLVEIKYKKLYQNNITFLDLSFIVFARHDAICLVLAYYFMRLLRSSQHALAMKLTKSKVVLS